MARRLKQLEQEDAHLKRIIADLMLDNVVLKELLAKSLAGPAGKRAAAKQAIERHGLSECRACRLVGLARPTKPRKLKAAGTMASGRDGANALVSNAATERLGLAILHRLARIDVSQ